MVLSSLLLLVSARQSSTAEAFFPLMPGAKLTYEESGQGIENVDEVGKPEAVEKLPATPVITRVNGRKVNVNYYRSLSDGIYLVANDPKVPYQEPVPVLKLGATKQTWSFETEYKTEVGNAVLHVECESVVKGKRKVLGQDVDVAEVTMNMRVGRDQRHSQEMKQVSVYARGIGLVEMTETSRLDRRVSSHTLRLTKFEPPPAGGR